MRDLKEAFHNVITNSMNADQVNQIGQYVNSGFDVYKISGFGHKLPVPRSVAADAAVEYFSSEEEIVQFFTHILKHEGIFMHQSRVYARGKEKLLDVLYRKDWIYDEESKRFRKDQRETFTSDWGFMQAGEDYQLAFAAIDIVGNSQIVRNNVRDDVENTFSRLRYFIQKQIEYRNGRIWFWHGDGGVAAFHNYNGINQAINAMIGLLTYLPLFNVFENELQVEDEIKLRIGLHFGRATYQKDTSKIISEDLKFSERLEKDFAKPNSVAVSSYIYKSLGHVLQTYFTKHDEADGEPIYLYERERLS